MPYARLAPDKLERLPLFGIEFVREDGDILWFQGPGDVVQAVNKHNPRIWFEDASDAHQAGACAILLASVADVEYLKNLRDTEVTDEGNADRA